jgi:hypothetical protein
MYLVQEEATQTMLGPGGAGRDYLLIEHDWNYDRFEKY